MSELQFLPPTYVFVSAEGNGEIMSPQEQIKVSPVLTTEVIDNATHNHHSHRLNLQANTLTHRATAPFKNKIPTIAYYIYIFTHISFICTSSHLG